MKIFYYALLPLLISSVGIYSSNNMTSTCTCPSSCKEKWRGDRKCDIECDYPSCHWDDGDCDPRGHYDGQCFGNVSLVNLDTNQELKTSCGQWAKMRRTCDDRDHLGLDLPWKVVSYGCEWVMNTFIPKPSLIGNRCHSLIPCVSDKWCQEDCTNQIKNFPQKCAWNPPKPVWVPTRRPTKFPTRRRTKRPTKYPTKFPTRYPTRYPTHYPTLIPSFNPTKFPTRYPTRYPIPNPSFNPTLNPSLWPTANPSIHPTLSPTYYPTMLPTMQPTSSPTKEPTSRAVIPPHSHDNSPSQPATHHHTTNNTYGAHPAVTIVAIVVVAIIIITVMCLYYRRQRYKENMREINARLVGSLVGDDVGCIVGSIVG